MLKVVVTGGAGFIGRHVVSLMLANGADVHVIDNLANSKREDVPESASFSRIDIRDGAAVTAAMEGADICIHLAAIASVQECITNWAYTHDVNVSGTINVFLAAASAGAPVIYASSAAIYGTNDALPLLETATPMPRSSYGVDKLSIELYALAARETHGLKSLGLRFFNIYGPGQDPTSPYSGVLSKFIHRNLAAQDMLIFGDGKQTRDFVYVADLAKIIWKLASSADDFDADVLNVCSGTATNLLDLAETVNSVSRQRVSTRHLDPQVGDIRHSLGSNDRLLQRLGATQMTDMQEGVRCTVEALSRHG